MTKQSRQDVDWWLGLTDVLAHGVGHGAEKLERIHLSIADESFNVLRQIPVTRPWSETVRVVHHGISRVAYGSVARAARGLGRFTRG